MTEDGRREPARRGRNLLSRLITLVLLYVAIGIGHHLYLEVRFQGDRFLNLDQRDDAASNLLRRPRQPDVATTLIDLMVSARSCTAVPLKNSELLVTAAHCVVEDDYSIAGGGSISLEYVRGGVRERVGLPGAEVLVHPRYLEVARLEPLNGFQRVFLSAFTWASIRGADRADSPYTWDVAVIRTPGRLWDFGVDGVTNEAAGPYLVEAYQNFADDGTPVCTLELVENCPKGTIASESVSQTRSGVRCAVTSIRRPSQVDGWVPCALMPGGSGGAVLSTRDGKTLLYGLVTGGDAWGEGNGITVDAVAELVAEALQRTP
jgi:hypothetical protein